MSCNLSEAIEERGINKGILRSIQSILKKKHSFPLTKQWIWLIFQRTSALNTWNCSSNSSRKCSAPVKGNYMSCNLSEAIEERGINRGIDIGINKGIDIGINKGIDIGINIGTLHSLQSILKKTPLSPDQAMDLIDIPESERAKFLELLKQQQP